MAKVTSVGFMKVFKFISKMLVVILNEISHELKPTNWGGTVHYLTNFSQKVLFALDYFEWFTKIPHKTSKNLTIQFHHTLIGKS